MRVSKDMNGLVSRAILKIVTNYFIFLKKNVALEYSHPINPIIFKIRYFPAEFDNQICCIYQIYAESVLCLSIYRSEFFCEIRADAIEIIIAHIFS